MRYSQLLIPTLREDPAEAEVVSHRLMLRAGMIRKLAAGIYATLPLGERVMQKTRHIIQEEMNRAGAQELTLPFVQPAEIWKQSGRWHVYGKELLRFKDRSNREFCLGPTHEEVITDLVKGVVTSYKQLPLILYQIHIKFRDEVRPRFGVMRAREFLMKDAYSFDADEHGAEASYQKMYAAYDRIFSRIGLTFRAVEADTGPIGGSFSHEFMVLAETGEDLIVSCTACGYGANMEKAEIRAPESLASSPAAGEPIQRVATPQMRTVEEVTAFLQVPAASLIKTLIFSGPEGPFAALVRGDHEINEVKLRNALGYEAVALADEAVIEEITRAPRGFAGPLGLTIPLIADYGLMGGGNFVAGGNEKDVHLIHVHPGRDFTITRFADIRQAQEGDPCPRCAGSLHISRGIEVGHIFKLGTKYSSAMGAAYLDQQGKERPLIMGCYGIGVGRTVAAAIEQSHDENGIIFPPAIAPFSVVIVPVNIKDPRQRQIAETMYAALLEHQIDALLDDRDERPGIKFKDTDLIGIPLRITIGARAVTEGNLDIKWRDTGETALVPVAEASARVVNIIKSRTA
jgi:prolyl-tRNA synthetase